MNTTRQLKIVVAAMEVLILARREETGPITQMGT